MSMEGLRQGAQNNRNQGGGGKGSRQRVFYARWKPPQMLDALRPFLAAPPNPEAITEVAEPIVVLAGDYQDPYARDPSGAIIQRRTEAFHYRAHNASVFIQKQGQKGFQSFREVICSCGPELHAPQPCVGCYYVDHGNKDMKPRDRWAFEIAHLGWYHHHPLIREGVQQVRRGSNEVLMVKDECFSYRKENEVLSRAAQRRVPNVKQPRQCEGCTPQMNYPFAWGDHRVLEVGSKHLQNLIDLNTELKKKCVNCGTFIMKDAFNCGNEKCNALLYEIGVSMQGWTNDQLEQFAQTPQRCSHCGVTSVPYTEFLCGFDQNYRPITGAGCPQEVEPREMSIFDNVLWVQREGQQTDSEIIIKKIESFQEFRTHDNRPLSDHLREIVPYSYDLAEMYKPGSLDEQAETIRQPNPYAPQAPQYQQYPVVGGPPGYQQPQPGYYGGPPQQQPYQQGPQQGYQQPQPQQQLPYGTRPNYGR